MWNVDLHHNGKGAVFDGRRLMEKVYADIAPVTNRRTSRQQKDFSYPVVFVFTMATRRQERCWGSNRRLHFLIFDVLGDRVFLCWCTRHSGCAVAIPVRIEDD
ncbi:hypothetical protein NDU88_011115 [Pleurodeles waltl]|uniref:Uncharacterized protein n=1 Tax=Pleurodeles waltl TaxID=8319 RepID=A0AAV7Q0U9_PLEWA|nr:hypothetical protein NDU88_011115 [Pleurodeles waltl]